MTFARTLLLVPVLVLAACAARSDSLPREPEPARARAALATVLVENQSPERVTIVYRIAGRGTAEVAIGQVAPRTSAALAPVPAGEPLLMIARTPAGAELALPARAFAIDGEWVWTIPADAAFVPPGRAEEAR